MQNKINRFIIVTGTRPCFMKSIPLAAEMDRQGIKYEIYNPCQHYDFQMSKIFEHEFNVKNIYHGHHKEDNPIKNIQEMIREFDKYINSRKVNIKGVFVVGDVNASLSCALVAHKHSLLVIHIESGLRSFDISMPEELNRITIDHISNILLADCQDALNNLKDENITRSVYLVGNLGIDSLYQILLKNKYTRSQFNKKILVTLHRRENLNHSERLESIFQELNCISKYFDIVFPIHPHTSKIIKCNKKLKTNNIKFVKPLGYIDFVKLLCNSKAVITDSGGIQEETTFMGIPCFTVRNNTERPVTITQGTNQLVSANNIFHKLLNHKSKEYKVPYLWDGHTSERIIDVMKKEKLI